MTEQPGEPMEPAPAVGEPGPPVISLEDFSARPVTEPDPVADSRQPFVPTTEEPGLEHDHRTGKAWESSTPGTPRNRGADWETRQSMRRELRGEYAADGFRHSSWSSDITKSSLE